MFIHIFLWSNLTACGKAIVATLWLRIHFLGVNTKSGLWYLETVLNWGRPNSAEDRVVRSGEFGNSMSGNEDKLQSQTARHVSRRGWVSSIRFEQQHDGTHLTFLLRSISRASAKMATGWHASKQVFLLSHQTGWITSWLLACQFGLAKLSYFEELVNNRNLFYATRNPVFCICSRVTRIDK